MDKHDGAEAFVEVLNANAVDTIFINPGADTVPVQVAVSRLKAEGKQVPKLVLCLDESVAMAAAHGHHMVSGKPQVVLVHSELGTLQVGGALHNAQWGRIPVVLWAGQPPPGSQRVNWLGEPFDQGCSVRSCVKWDHGLRPDENIHDVLREAFRRVSIEPSAPVYLSYPRESLVQKVDKVAVSPQASKAAPSTLVVDDGTLTTIAEALVSAANPLIVAGYVGRHPEAVASLVELAETLAAPVLSGPTRMNFPTTHPLFAGTEVVGGRGRTSPHIADPDVVLVIDYDTQYAPARPIPGPNTRMIIHIDLDPSTQGRPLWGRGADLFVKADSRDAMPALTRELRRRTTPQIRTLLQERVARLEDAYRRQRAELRDRALGAAGERPVSPDWLCRCVNQVIDDDTILVQQILSHSVSVAEQIDRTRPGTMMSCAGGSIQWALGASLGAKLAAPKRTVVSLVTDGGFVWGCPVATLWTAGTYHAPFLAIVFNNGGYGAIRGAVQRAYGAGKLAADTAFEAAVNFGAPLDYAAIARACGAHGRTVAEPDDVLPALKEGLERVRDGQPAVVDVKLELGP